ncbi:unnamed protein product [Pleuronectes platessa]|uniref:Uncharacterized protein n=1 Tax=Pleuronectes platessa TaxID=8262 RepID=A0A9N7UXL0_PLEPL|nr:unnamed protein product [Pleuronectes platessa]
MSGIYTNPLANNKLLYYLVGHRRVSGHCLEDPRDMSTRHDQRPDSISLGDVRAEEERRSADHVQHSVSVPGGKGRGRGSVRSQRLCERPRGKERMMDETLTVIYPQLQDALLLPDIHMKAGFSRSQSSRGSSSIVESVLTAVRRRDCLKGLELIGPRREETSS